MQAMVLERPGAPLRPREVAVPAPEAGRMLLRVRACGVCRTDLRLLDGELPDPRLPLIPGHEIVGTVVARGDDVDDAFRCRLSLCARRRLVVAC